MSTEDDLREAVVIASQKKLDAPTLLRMREDVVPATYRGLVRKCTRLDVPFLNPFLLRECGNILAGLGQALVATTHKNHLDETHQLLDGYHLVRNAQSRILYLRGGKSVAVSILDV